MGKLWLSLFLFTSCATIPGLDSEPPITAQIHLTHLGGQEFELQYQLNQPVPVLSFAHKGHPFRQTTFQPIDSNMVMGIREGREFLARKDGAPFQEAKIRFRPFFGDMPQEYSFSLKFSDESVAIYTAHLAIEVAPGKLPSTTFHFHPLPSDGLVFNGKVFRGTQLWQPVDDLRDIYVYFGAISPQVFGALTVLADPVLPVWLQRLSADGMLKIFSLYEKELGFRPISPPFVLINVDDMANPKEGSFRGSSATGWIHLGLKGGQWRNFSENMRRRFLFFIGHEGFHQFQGRSNPDFQKVAWLIEGSADFFADRALRKLNFLTKKGHREKIANSANRCVQLLKEHPTALNNLDPKANFSITYACGRILHETAHAVLRQPEGLIGLWKYLYAHTNTPGDAKEMYFNEELYFAGLRELGAPEKFIRMAKKFLVESQPDPQKAIGGLFYLAGIKYRLEADPKGQPGLRFIL